MSTSRASNSSVPQPDIGRLLRIADVMAQLNISRTTIYRLTTAGALEAVKIGNARRITLRSVNKYLASLSGSAERER